jgi:hypothetical protein
MMLCQCYANVNSTMSARAVGEVYSYVHNHNIQELMYPTAGNDSPTSTKTQVRITPESYRATLCGMLQHNPRFHSYQYIIMRPTNDHDITFEKHISGTTGGGDAANTHTHSFIFEYPQLEETFFFLVLVVSETQELQIYSVCEHIYHASLQTDTDNNHIAYKDVLHKIETYMYEQQTIAVSMLLTRYTQLHSVLSRYPTFDNFIHLVLKYCDVSDSCATVVNNHDKGVHATQTTVQPTTRRRLQHFTDLQLLLAIQCIYATDPNCVDFLLDEVNFLDSIGHVFPALLLKQAPPT